MELYVLDNWPIVPRPGGLVGSLFSPVPLVKKSSLLTSQVIIPRILVAVPGYKMLLFLPIVVSTSLLIPQLAAYRDIILRVTFDKIHELSGKIKELKKRIKNAFKKVVKEKIEYIRVRETVLVPVIERISVPVVRTIRTVRRVAITVLRKVVTYTTRVVRVVKVIVYKIRRAIRGFFGRIIGFFTKVIKRVIYFFRRVTVPVVRWVRKKVVRYVEVTKKVVYYVTKTVKRYIRKVVERVKPIVRKIVVRVRDNELIRKINNKISKIKEKIAFLNRAVREIRSFVADVIYIARNFDKLRASARKILGTLFRAGKEYFKETFNLFVGIISIVLSGKILEFLKEIVGTISRNIKKFVVETIFYEILAALRIVKYLVKGIRKIMEEKIREAVEKFKIFIDNVVGLLTAPVLGKVFKKLVKSALKVAKFATSFILFTLEPASGPLRKFAERAARIAARCAGVRRVSTVFIFDGEKYLLVKGGNDRITRWLLKWKGARRDLQTVYRDLELPDVLIISADRSRKVYPGVTIMHDLERPFAATLLSHVPPTVESSAGAKAMFLHEVGHLSMFPWREIRVDKQNKLIAEVANVMEDIIVDSRIVRALPHRQSSIKDILYTHIDRIKDSVGLDIVERIKKLAYVNIKEGSKISIQKYRRILYWMLMQLFRK